MDLEILEKLLRSSLEFEKSRDMCLQLHLCTISLVFVLWLIWPSDSKCSNPLFIFYSIMAKFRFRHQSKGFVGFCRCVYWGPNWQLIPWMAPWNGVQRMQNLHQGQATQRCQPICQTLPCAQVRTHTYVCGLPDLPDLGCAGSGHSMIIVAFVKEGKNIEMD